MAIGVFMHMKAHHLGVISIVPCRSCWLSIYHLLLERFAIALLLLQLICISLHGSNGYSKAYEQLISIRSLAKTSDQ